MKATNESGHTHERNNFMDNIFQDLHNRQQEIIGTSRYALITLFWEIGKQINEYSRQETQLPSLATIQEELIAKYGPLFKEVQLHIMWRFSQIVTAPAIVSKMASYFDWHHISLFALLQNEEEVFHFVDRTYRDNLSSGQLEKEINSLHPHGNKASGPIAYTVDQNRLSGILPEPGTVFINKVPKDSLYTGYLAAAFAKLFDSYADGEMLAGQEDLSFIIHRLIQKFRANHSNRLNGRLNLILLELGRMISDEIAVNKNGVVTPELIATLLREKFDSPIFSEHSISGAVLFFEKNNDRSKAIRIAHLIKWEDLLVLLKLHDLEDLLIYARLLAQKKLAVSGHIPDNLLEDERRLLKETAVPNKETIVSVKKKRNDEFIIKENFVTLDHDIINDRFVMDIFSNPYFMSLMREEWVPEV